jgi:hypothetical protein
MRFFLVAVTFLTMQFSLSAQADCKEICFPHFVQTQDRGTIVNILVPRTAGIKDLTVEAAITNMSQLEASGVCKVNWDMVKAIISNSKNTKAFVKERLAEIKQHVDGNPQGCTPLACSNDDVPAAASEKNKKD